MMVVWQWKTLFSVDTLCRVCVVSAFTEKALCGSGLQGFIYVWVRGLFRTYHTRTSAVVYGLGRTPFFLPHIAEVRNCVRRYPNVISITDIINTTFITTTINSYTSFPLNTAVYIRGTIFLQPLFPDCLYNC